MNKKNENTITNMLAKTYLNIPKIGDIIEGKIFQLNKNGVFIDLNNFKTGIILAKEFKENPEYFKNIKIEDKISVKFVGIENEDGYIEVSLKEAGSEKNWEEIKEMTKQEKIIKAKVIKANKGGLMLKIGGLQAFMPVSQLTSKHYPRVEGGDSQKILQALQKLVKQELEVKIIDIDPIEEKLIVSEKATQEKEIKEIIKKHKVGDTIEGTVTGIVNFGVFVKFNDLEGLVHISELDYQLIENPQDIVKIGDKVKAKIIEIEKDKISLSIKALKKNPWEKVEEKYKIGEIVKGIVTKFNSFGTFIQLDKHIHGLTHISEFGTEKRMKELLEIGKKYDFKILAIKSTEYRMALRPIFKEKK